MVAGARISRSAMIFELNFVYGHAVRCMKIELGVDRNELVCSFESERGSGQLHFLPYLHLPSYENCAPVS